MLLRPFEVAGFRPSIVDVGDFLAIGFGEWVLEFEGWQPECLTAGVGRFRAHWYEDEDGESDDEDGDDWDDPVGPEPPCDAVALLDECIMESQIRVAALPETDPDGPPAGALEWVMDIWMPWPGREESFTQLCLWRVNRS